MIRKRYNQVPNLTQDTTWESNKNTINITNKSQGVRQWTDAKAWETQDTQNTNDPQKKHRFWTVSKNILLKGLNRFQCANLTLSSDVDQDT